MSKLAVRGVEEAWKEAEGEGKDEFAMRAGIIIGNISSLPI